LNDSFEDNVEDLEDDEQEEKEKKPKKMPGFRSLHSEEYASPTNYKQKLSIVEIRKQLTKVLES